MIDTHPVTSLNPVDPDNLSPFASTTMNGLYFRTCRIILMITSANLTGYANCWKIKVTEFSARIANLTFSCLNISIFLLYYHINLSFSCSYRPSNLDAHLTALTLNYDLLRMYLAVLLRWCCNYSFWYLIASHCIFFSSGIHNSLKILLDANYF